MRGHGVPSVEPLGRAVHQFAARRIERGDLLRRSSRGGNLPQPELTALRFFIII